MDLLQRLPKALLVTAVAFLFFGGTVGMVVAAGTEPLPEYFGVPAPMEGDRWSYEIQDTTGNLDSATAPSQIVFEWLPSDIVFDAEGYPHHVQPLVEMGNQWQSYVDHESKQIIASSTVSSASFQNNGIINLYATDDRIGFGPGTSYSENTTTVGYDEVPVPCGFISNLQGTQQPTKDTITIEGDCKPWSLVKEPVLFRAFEVIEINGMQTVGFVTERDGDLVRLWFSSAIPYPVRMEFQFEALQTSDPEAQRFYEMGPNAPTHGVTIDMTGFSRGEIDWGIPIGPLPEPFGPLQIGNVDLEGPDDSAIEHPYPFSEAIANARADPSFVEFQQYQLDHSDAQVGAAFHRILENSDEITHQWYYGLYDGDDGFLVVSERVFQKAVYDVSGSDAVTYRETHQNPSVPALLINEAGTREVELVLPEQAPDFKSAFNAYKKATGYDADSYGFVFLRPTGDNPTDYGEEPHIFVGRSHLQYNDDAAGQITGGDADLNFHYLHFDVEGKLIEEIRYLAQTRSTSDSAVSLAAPTPGEETGAQESSGLARQALWMAPPAEATAGISFVALLIGAVYWLWPSIKIIPMFGMFTRFQPDELLENPLRANIFELIRENPGIHYQGLSRAVGKGGSVVDHHMRKLHQGGYITIQKGAGLTCYFVKGAVDHRIMVAVPTVKAEGASRILRELLQKPGQNASNLAESLGIAKSTVSYHVSRLRKAELLEEGRDLVPTENAEKVMTYAA